MNNQYKSFEKNIDPANCKVLLVGVGGIGTEILKCLVLSGFRRIDIVDYDFVEISNVSRQLFFRLGDEGKSKVHVLAANATKHFKSAKGLEIRPFHSDISDFFSKFKVSPADYNIVLSALDNINARRCLNAIIMTYSNPKDSPVLIDSGTEGFNGHCRLIIPKKTSCYECTMGLNVQDTNFPLCEIKEFPRTPIHCIAYANFIYEENKNDGQESKNQRISKIYNLALEHAKYFGIQGVTLELTQQIIGHIFPTLLSTNTIIASCVVSQAIKYLKGFEKEKDFKSYFMYYAQTGIYSSSFEIQKDENCIFCKI
ncbi:ubiquitin-activating enzyme [Cryptosporidium ubiquitum]|uniref:NEDD8-activating enzyme E1 catalytic subunit n=1 Tax=Cryptosporidium ubiquitum TaxID=857276 RepID=A0A1J4MJG8_9CRYT|nr:ubiquitin-activating enzyme [Cryptosporidium ubiquitum]OII73603.1 ubiquitin-activating enzyme [Cryptosporidium ubiquitum]